MIKKILPASEPSLRCKSRPVKKIDKKTLSLVKDLKDTIAAQEDPEGVGLAAPQIGKNVQVFVMKPARKITTIINPKIISISKEKIKKSVKGQFQPGTRKTTRAQRSHQKKIMEGCLSLPHFYGPVDRANKIKIKYTDENGKKKIKTFKGLEAQIVQHEIEHLKGILFIDKLLQQKGKLYEYVNGAWEEVDLIT